MIKFPGLDDKDLDALLKAFSDINNNLTKSMKSQPNNKKNNKNKINKPTIETKAWINGKEVDISNFDINDILNNIGFGGLHSMFDGFSNENEYQNEFNNENNITFEKDAMLKNIKVIEGILKICNIKDSSKIFNSINFDYNKNNDILNNNKIENITIRNLINSYHIDLSLIKEIKKFLNCLKYAVTKKEIIF